MAATGSWRVILVITAHTCFACISASNEQQITNSTVVTSGYELHAALTSRQITRIYVSNNVTFTLDTCPFPASEEFPATIISRNITITSLRNESFTTTASSSSNSNSSDIQQHQAGPPYTINCDYLQDRFEVHAGFTVNISDLILVNCATPDVFGFIRKAPGSSVSFHGVVDDRASVCPPLQRMYDDIKGRASQNQSVQLSAEGENWCETAAGASANSSSTSAAAQGSASSQFVSPLTAANPLCQQQALLLTDVTFNQSTSLLTNTEPATTQDTFNFSATDSAVLCPRPVSEDCIRDRGLTACLAEAYRAVNPDVNRPCPVISGYTLQACLADSTYTRLIVLQSSSMNLSTSPAQRPILISRNVTIMSDPRGPRLLWDCGHLSNRFQLQPGYQITLYHIILTRCSSIRLLNFIRLSAGSQVVINDTFVNQTAGLCMPLNPRPVNGSLRAPAGIYSHAARPENIPGLQSYDPGQPGSWCNRNDSAVTGQGTGSSVVSSGAAGDVDVIVEDLQVFANTTGLGPSSAVTLPRPTSTPFYNHPSWTGNILCNDTNLIPPLLMKNYAYNLTPGWVDGAAANATLQQYMAAVLPGNVSHGAGDHQQQQDALAYGPEADLVGGSYGGTVVFWFINSVLLCPQMPREVQQLQQCKDPWAVSCITTVYSRVDPDRLMVPGSAAYEEAQGAAAAGGGGGGGGRNYGVQVVLPAVLGSVGGAAILLAVFAAFVSKRRKHQSALAAVKQHHGDPVAHQVVSDPYRVIPADANALSWLRLHPHDDSQASPGSSDPGRQLLTSQYTRSLLSGPSARAAAPAGTSGLIRPGDVQPDGIQLTVLLGAGSFGRVYAGTWQGAPVAVKVISHSAADDDKITQELALSLSFNHPNLVRALHYTRIKINPHSLDPNEVEGGSDLFLPEGAVGVFSLPSNWAVVQRAQAASAIKGAPAIDTETWIVMDLMDQGNMAAALRHSDRFMNEGGQLNVAALLRRAADVAAGLSYLHSRNVCHGDLKWENVLLQTEPQDPEGVIAKIADFGLSRALAFGQSHLSTRCYGTVTHMPPELLVMGKLTPAADVYSFGIMMWELVTRSLPFAGLHHGEVIHKVVTEDLRPGPWTLRPDDTPLPADYVLLTEECWSRKVESRPTMPQVLERLLIMLAQL